MAYTAISDFKFGMDRRRPQVSGVPGTLWISKNCVTTRGGDIERAKKFVKTEDLPAGTFGFYAIRGQRYVFGSIPEPPGMPIGVKYIRLQSPSGSAMTRVYDARGFDGKLYVIAGYDSGNVYHFYDGVRVTAWDALANESATLDLVASRLADQIDAQAAYRAKAYRNVIEITAAVPGVPFTLSGSAGDNAPVSNPRVDITAVRANVAAVAEVRAQAFVLILGGTSSPGVNRIVNVTVDGTPLMASPVDWNESNAVTANAVAVEINNQSSEHGYTAAADNDYVRLTAAIGTGSAANGRVVSVTVGGDVTTSTALFLGGVDKVAPVAQIWTAAIQAQDVAYGNITITGGTTSVGVNRITSIKVGGTELLEIPVNFTTSNSDTAQSLAAAINGYTATSGFVAANVGPTVALSAPDGRGKSLGGSAIAVTVGGDVTFTTTPMAWNSYASDVWSLILDGQEYISTGLGAATGTSLIVNKSRIYSLAGSLIRFSKINTPTDWSDNDASAGAGFVNVSNEVDGVEFLVGGARYSNLIAVFARNSIITYSLPADAEAIEVIQPIENTGTVAARSVVSYGAEDVYYLDETGIRSLKTRNQIDAAYASDVGSAIDPFVQEIIASLPGDKVSRASAVIEPQDGRYMLALGPYILVLSSFPSSKISAWSYIDFGADISDMIRVQRSVQLRSGDAIYTYGGVDGTTYPDADEFEAFAETPFITSKDPAGEKILQGFDMAAVNTWRVQVLPNPNNPEHFIDAGIIDGTTYHLPANMMPGATTHYALRMTCSAAGFASLSSVAVHHQSGERQ